MSNFYGHAIPGTLMILLGLFYFLRSLSSRVSFLRGLRTKQFWMSAEALSFVFYGALGAVGEFLDALLPRANFSESHLDHMRITTTLCIAGIIMLLHLYKVLDHPGWALVMPLGFVFIATQLSAHPQGSDIETFAHQFTAVLLCVTAVSRLLEIMIGIYGNKPYLKRIQSKVASWKRKGGKKLSRSFYFLDVPRHLCCCWCCCGSRVRDSKEEEEEVMLGMNPGYYNPYIYQTPFPFITAVSMLFNGVWWWEMANSFFSNDGKGTIPEHHRMNPMATHFAYGHMVFPHFIWMVCFLAFLTILAQWIDTRFCSKDILSEEIQEDDQLELQIVNVTQIGGDDEDD